MLKCTLTMSLIALLILLLPSQLLSQPEVEWQRSYGGEDEDYFSDLAQTNDGGFILVGSETSFGHPDPDTWVVKTDQNGETEWTQEFDGEQIDRFYRVIQTEDDGYLFAGRYSLMKTDYNCQIVWSLDIDFSVREIIQAPDGGYSVSGNVEEDFYLMKLDQDGQEIRICQFDGGEDDFCYSHIRTNDGCYMLVGATDSFEAMRGDALMVKINADGEVEWNRTFGGRRADYFTDVIQTEDGGYVMVGINESIGVESRTWVLKTDGEGEFLWEHGNVNVQARSRVQIFPSDVGGFTLIGADNYNGLYRANADGEEIWSLELRDVYVRYAGRSVTTDDGGYAIGCTDYNERGNLDLLKLSPDPESAPPSSLIPHPSSFILLPPYPNPFNSKVGIEFSLPLMSQYRLTVVDISGREVAVLGYGNQQAGRYRTFWNAKDHSSGIYFARLDVPGRKPIEQKLVLVK
ncbi:T9SS type A sorting domain-containing protein [bacterium]|nr:T9SS type A sorting domain-containing protein [bacterium]